MNNYSHPSPSPLPAPGRRVLHVLEATLGGTMRYIRDLAEASEGFPITFGLAYATERADYQLSLFLDRARQLGWELYPVDMRRTISPARDARNVKTLVEVMRLFRPDVVHCHSSKAGALGRVATLAIWPRPTVIYSPHAITAGDVTLFLWIERFLARTTHLFVASSKSEREQLVSLRVAKAKHIYVVPPFIDTVTFNPQQIAAASRDPSSPFHVVAVGRLCAQKRPYDFLHILAEVRRSLPAVTATWVGDGDLRDRFEKERRLLDLDNVVTLTGWVEDVRPYLAAADALLSTSAFESFGYMVAEGMAMALPIVATRVVGTIDFSGGREITFYPTGGISQAATALIEIGNKPATAKVHGNANRAYVMERLSKEEMRSSLLKCYSQSTPSLPLG